MLPYSVPDPSVAVVHTAGVCESLLFFEQLLMATPGKMGIAAPVLWAAGSQYAQAPPP